MLVLHGNWADTSMTLWAESVPAASWHAAQASPDEVTEIDAASARQHPFAADSSSILARLRDESLVKEGKRKSQPSGEGSRQ